MYIFAGILNFLGLYTCEFHSFYVLLIGWLANVDSLKVLTFIDLNATQIGFSPRTLLLLALHHERWVGFGTSFFRDPLRQVRDANCNRPVNPPVCDYDLRLAIRYDKSIPDWDRDYLWVLFRSIRFVTSSTSYDSG